VDASGEGEGRYVGGRRGPPAVGTPIRVLAEEPTASKPADNAILDTIEGLRVRLIDGNADALDNEKESFTLWLGEDEARLLFGLLTDTLEMNQPSDLLGEGTHRTLAAVRDRLGSVV